MVRSRLNIINLIYIFLAYRCAYCSQWNPSPKPKPQLAIGYDNNSLTQNGRIISESIEDITDEISLKSDSEHEQKDLIISKS